MVLNERLKALVDTIPKAICGVYYLYNKDGDVIYIGKSINIRKRMMQHFQSTEQKEVKLQHFTHCITFENTGNELIALLRESELIKMHLPIFNRAQRKIKFFYGLYTAKTPQGYDALLIKKLHEQTDELMSFTSLAEAKNYLFAMTEKYFLCQKINGLYTTNSSCFQYSLKECFGACIAQEETEAYNLRVKAFIQTTHLPKKNFLFELAGRHPNEKGIVFIEKGVYKGFGFCALEVTDPNELAAFIEPKQDNRDVRRIVFRHIRAGLPK